jgi:hypothetical protein
VIEGAKNDGKEDSDYLSTEIDFFLVEDMASIDIMVSQE